MTVLSCPIEIPFVTVRSDRLKYTRPDPAANKHHTPASVCHSVSVSALHIHATYQSRHHRRLASICNSATCVWNILPPVITTLTSVSVFQRLLCLNVCLLDCDIWLFFSITITANTIRLHVTWCLKMTHSCQQQYEIFGIYHMLTDSRNFFINLQQPFSLPYYKKFVVLDKQKHFVNEHVYQNETASMKQRQNRAQITASTYQN